MTSNQITWKKNSQLSGAFTTRVPEHGDSDRTAKTGRDWPEIIPCVEKELWKCETLKGMDTRLKGQFLPLGFSFTTTQRSSPKLWLLLFNSTIPDLVVPSSRGS